MSRAKKLADALEPILRTVECGTQDYPRTMCRLDVAFQRAEDRAGGGQLPTATRGGSSDPEERDENKERDRTKRQAEKDAWDISVITARMVTDAKTLATITARQVELIHDSKRPLNALPGCRSCGRKEQDNDQTIGGHFREVYADGLCRPCWDFKSATGGLPPVRWCHLHHTQGRKAPNIWLAKEFPALLQSVQRVQKSKGITAEDLALAEGVIVA